MCPVKDMLCRESTSFRSAQHVVLFLGFHRQLQLLQWAPDAPPLSFLIPPSSAQVEGCHAGHQWAGARACASSSKCGSSSSLVSWSLAVARGGVTLGSLPICVTLFYLCSVSLYLISWFGLWSYWEEKNSAMCSRRETWISHVCLPKNYYNIGPIASKEWLIEEVFLCALLSLSLTLFDDLWATAAAGC